MKSMEVTPFLGSTFPQFFPVILVLFSLGTLFNLYTRFVTACCFKSFQRFIFDDDFADVQIDQGRDILARGKLRRDRDIDIYIDR